MINYLLARVKQFLHCLLHFHRLSSYHDVDGNILWVGCWDCGRTFWSRKP